MRILNLKKEGTFGLDKVDIGDYLEAEFVSYGGCKANLVQGMNVYCIYLRLTFCAVAMEPEEVELRTAAHSSAHQFRELTPGEKITMIAQKVHDPFYRIKVKRGRLCS